MLSSKDLSLAVGQKIILTTLGENFDSFIRGWREGEYIIIDMPMFKGGPLSIATHAGCQLVYTREGQFMKFKSSVLKAPQHPPLFLVISYPKFIERNNLRKHERYQTHIPIIFKCNDGSENPGVIRDISLEGALITHSIPLARDAKVIITAALKMGNMEDLVSVVRNVRKYNKNGETFEASGMEFLQPSAKNERLLLKIVDLIKNKDKQSSLV